MIVGRCNRSWIRSNPDQPSMSNKFWDKSVGMWKEIDGTKTKYTLWVEGKVIKRYTIK